jgi:hypothetical protein
VSALILDAGALVAVDRGDRSVVIRLDEARRADLRLRTTGVVVAQVWRDPRGRQAALARFLRAVDLFPMDLDVGQRGGVLMGAAGSADAVDATLVAAANDGDRILTSDPRDIARLVAASGRRIAVIPC